MQEVPIVPPLYTALLTLWAAIGPLVGVFVGYFLNRRWQKHQILLSYKKADYEAILKSLAEVTGPTMQAKVIPREEEIKKAIAAENKLYETIGIRIFVEAEIREMNLFDRVVTELNHYKSAPRDDVRLTRQFKLFIDEVRAKAQKLI